MDHPIVEHCFQLMAKGRDKLGLDEGDAKRLETELAAITDLPELFRAAQALLELASFLRHDWDAAEISDRIVAIAHGAAMPRFESALHALADKKRDTPYDGRSTFHVNPKPASVPRPPQRTSRLANELRIGELLTIRK